MTLSFLLVRNSNRIQSSIIGSIGITHSKERVVRDFSDSPSVAEEYMKAAGEINDIPIILLLRK